MGNRKLPGNNVIIASIYIVLIDSYSWFHVVTSYGVLTSNIVLCPQNKDKYKHLRSNQN